jgi:hypothetical protein
VTSSPSPPDLASPQRRFAPDGPVRVGLEVPPVFDGMIAIDGKLLLSRTNGKVTGYTPQDEP